MVDRPIIHIRPYKPGDEEAINSLFNTVFHKTRTIEEWDWKFRDNPAVRDMEEWIIVAESNGRIISHYANMPTEIKYNNGLLTAGQYVDIMIDPLARKNAQLFWKLVREHSKNSKKTTSFTFGFPNEIAYQVGKLFLGYKDLGGMVQLFKRLSFRSALKRRFPWCPKWIINFIHAFSKIFYQFNLMARTTDGNIIVKTVNMFDERIDKFWNTVKDRYGIMVVRNLSYLNWRYKNKQYSILIGEEGGELIGYAVTKIEDNNDARVGYIIDILSCDNKTTSLLKGALQLLLKQDVDYVLSALLAHDPLCTYHRKLGFKRHKEFKPIQVTITPLTKEVDTKYLLNQENWHITYGDTDGF
ncbi:MAG: GNAT family N-acetyltransferase [wastewater metagenome]|nr:GNAT family N-acetyltransferase [Candidatus Loosdrechtia aerotolerans]